MTTVKALLIALVLLQSHAVSAVVPQSSAPPPASSDDLGKLKQQMDSSKTSVDRESLPGAAIYHARCEICHAGQAPKAPSRTFLDMMAPEAIYTAVSSGIMQQQAAGLTDADKRHVAEYLSGTPFGAVVVPPAPTCVGKAAKFDLTQQPDIVGWGFTPGNTHSISADIAHLEAKDIPRLKVKWVLGYPHAVRARSRPTFAYGALYVGSQDGVVYALDAKSGCIRWTFKTSAEVRTPVVIPAGQSTGVKRAYFGDLIGRVYAVDALTGRELWRTRVEEHPSATITAAPIAYGDSVYVGVSSLEEATVVATYPCCTFRGSVVALDGATGKVRWKRYTIDETPQQVGTTDKGVGLFAPSGAAVWNAPTLDVQRGLLYVGTGNNYTGPADSRSNAILAMDLRTGEIRWAWQIVGGDAWNVGCMVGLPTCPKNSGPDADIGSGVVFGTLADGTQRFFVGLKSGRTLSVDPDTHDRALWTVRLGRGSIQGGIQFGMAFDGQRLYVPIADMGNSMDVSTQARDADAGAPRPGLYAIDPNSGAILWQAKPPDACNGRAFCDRGILASIAAIPGAVFAGHMDGWVRAYDSASGRVVWEYDTTQETRTLNGTTARGGSIGGSGPVVHDGMLYVNSGYGLYFHMPGNALIAFSVDGK